MDAWPQRERFRERLQAYLKQTGKTQAEAAEELGISLPHLRNSMYRKDKRLGREPLELASALFGCRVTEFTDDPGGDILGQDVSNLSEHDRVLAHMMFHDFTTADDLTTEDRKALVDAYNLNRAALRALKARRS